MELRGSHQQTFGYSRVLDMRNARRFWQVPSGCSLRRTNSRTTIRTNRGDETKLRSGLLSEGNCPAWHPGRPRRRYPAGRSGHETWGKLYFGKIYSPTIRQVSKLPVCFSFASGHLRSYGRGASSTNLLVVAAIAGGVARRSYSPKRNVPHNRCQRPEFGFARAYRNTSVKTGQALTKNGSWGWTLPQRQKYRL